MGGREGKGKGKGRDEGRSREWKGGEKGGKGSRRTPPLLFGQIEL